VGWVPTPLWLALFPNGSDPASPSSLDPCPSCALFTRPIQTEVGGRQSVPDLVTSYDSGSCKLRSLNLSAMKRRDPRTHLHLVSPYSGHQLSWFLTRIKCRVLTDVEINGNTRDMRVYKGLSLREDKNPTSCVHQCIMIHWVKTPFTHPFID
jgi:hypothetical protein